MGGLNGEPEGPPMRWGHPNGNHDPYAYMGQDFSCGCLLAMLIFSVVAAAVITGIIMHATHTPLLRGFIDSCDFWEKCGSWYPGISRLDACQARNPPPGR